MSESAMVEAIHKDGQRKMTVSEVDSVKGEINDIEAQVKRIDNPKTADEARPDLLQSRDSLIKRKKKLEESLNRDEDLVAKGIKKDGCKARMKQIEEIIRKDVPTEREMRAMPTHQQDFNKAVEKTYYYQKTHGKLIEEWQELDRRLNPNDPEAGDTSKLW